MVLWRWNEDIFNFCSRYWWLFAWCNVWPTLSETWLQKQDWVFLLSLRMCFVERYLAILGCNHLDQESHLHLPPHYWNYTRNLIINWNVVFVAQLAQTPAQTESWIEKMNKRLFVKQSLSFTAFSPFLFCLLKYTLLWKEILMFDHWIKFYLVFKIKLSIKPPNSNDPSFESTNYSWNQVTGFSSESFPVRYREVGQEISFHAVISNWDWGVLFSVCF